ncbi:MAG TPA: hypothetical protein VFE47_28140 [Tepidisphaeraceae bacterium]|jgi:uncharacterized delta-60 repeat protein|nr:hypothetical protein [Tepidisphaeraceae bacterium]
MASVEGLESRVLFTAGSVDHSFGSGGQIDTPTSDTNELIVVQKNGAFIVAGAAVGSDLELHGFLERFHANGKPDTSFGSHGRVDLSPNQFSDVISLTLAPDGKIVVIGSQAGVNNVLVRFTSNGKLDTHFGTGGMTTLPANLLSPKAKIENNQSIVIGADLNLDPNSTVVDGSPDAVGEILHYTRNGAVDTNFGTDGVVTTELGAGYLVGDFEAFGNSQIEALFYATSQTSTEYNGSLERFAANGSLTSTFQQNTAIGIAAPHSYRFLPNGDFLVLMPGIDGGITPFAYTAAGIPDLKFANQGAAATLPFASNNQAINGPDSTDRTVVETGDKLLVVEQGTNSPTSYIAFGGLSANGKIDKTFGKTGVVQTTSEGQIDALAGDGSRVILLETLGGSPSQQAIVAYKI